MGGTPTRSTNDLDNRPVWGVGQTKPLLGPFCERIYHRTVISQKAFCRLWIIPVIPRSSSAFFSFRWSRFAARWAILDSEGLCSVTRRKQGLDGDHKTEADVTENSHLSLKLSPPHVKVSSSASMNPSSPCSLKALPLSRLTRFFFHFTDLLRTDHLFDSVFILRVSSFSLPLKPSRTSQPCSFLREHMVRARGESRIQDSRCGAGGRRSSPESR